MKNNFFNKSIGNINSRPFLNSEVTSQILYGEKFKILSKSKGWVKIKTKYDNYTGFIKSQKFLKKFKPTNILIHDAARPYINKTDLNKLLKIFTTTGVALGYPLTNAIKYVNNNHVVISSIDRNNLVASFTPQKFNFRKLYNAYKKVLNDKINVDDDLEVMTYDSHKVKIMISSPGNIKITYKDDLYVLSKLLS